MTDALSVHREFAAILYQAGVPCPSARDCLILMTIIGGVDEVLQRNITPAAAVSLKAYHDALLSVSGIWLGHLALTRAEAQATAATAASEGI